MAILTPIKALVLNEIEVDVIMDMESVQLLVMVFHHKMGKINSMEQ